MAMLDSPVAGRLGALLKGTSGNFATMSALVAPVAITLAAFAVDEAALYVERREAQAVTDLAAIAAAANIDRAEEAASETLADNGLLDLAPAGHGQTPGTPTDETDDEPVTVVPGHYHADPTMAVNERFAAGDSPYNAVRVTFAKTGKRYFSKAFFEPPRMSVSAIASAYDQAAFSVGSRLLRLDGGILNDVLGGLTGSELSLTVMDYESLLAADAELFAFLDFLATDLDLEVATYADVLDTEVTIGRLAGALAETDGVTGRARGAAEHIERAAGGPGAPRLRLAQLFDVGPYDSLPVGARITDLSARASALEMLTAAAAIANGENQVALDLAGSVPGLVGLDLGLAIGEPPQHAPWLALGAGGEVVRTAQTRLRLVVEVGGILGSAIRLPLYLDIAFAEARLADVSCPGGRAENVEVAVDARPGVADLRIADIDPHRLHDFAAAPGIEPARIVSAPLVKVTGRARVEIANGDFTTLDFDARDIEDLAVKRVSTTKIADSLLTSLLGDLRLNVEIAGLGLGPPSGISGTVARALEDAAPKIDSLLVNLLSALGVSIGEADVRVHGASCGRPVLVQ